MRVLISAMIAVIVISVFASNGLAADYKKGLEAAKKGDYATALKEWKPLAENGDSGAQADLGRIYRDGGGGVQQDYKEAFRWYKMSAEQGNTVAMIELALLYGNGKGVTQNNKETVRWMTAAAEGGNMDGMLNLGNIYYGGYFGAAQSYTEAMKWYEQSANKGKVIAMMKLGAIYMDGKGVEVNNREAIYWYEKAAYRKNIDSMVNAASLYYNEYNDVMTYAWFAVAASYGDTEAQNAIVTLNKSMKPDQVKEGKNKSEQILKTIKESYYQ